MDTIYCTLLWTDIRNKVYYSSFCKFNWSKWTSIKWSMQITTIMYWGQNLNYSNDKMTFSGGGGDVKRQSYTQTHFLLIIWYKFFHITWSLYKVNNFIISYNLFPFLASNWAIKGNFQVLSHFHSFCRILFVCVWDFGGLFFF